MQINKPKIAIGSPCTENWGNMTPDEQGRFCDKCAMTVRDVSTWSDDRIVEEYQNQDGKLCIRMPYERQEQILASPSTPRLWTRVLTWVAVAISFLHYTRQSVARSLPFVNPTPSIKDSTKTEVDRMTIKGRVADSVETNLPLPGAHIRFVKNGQPLTSVISDMNGQFDIVFEDIKTDDTLSIQIDYLGYETLHDTLEVKDSLKCDFYLSESFVCLNEAVKVAGRNRIIQGGAFMGISIDIRNIEPRRIYKFDEYDTKSYHQDDLQRYNFGRD